MTDLDHQQSWLMKTLFAPGYPQPIKFSGQVLFANFETELDLSAWVPYPLQVSDPHRAFLKVYRLKMRPLVGRPKSPAYSQYSQVCLTVQAAPPGQPLGHYNILLWEARDWSIGSNVLGWQKKLAAIDMTWLYPTLDSHDADDATDLFQADVHLAGQPLVTLRSRLDGSVGEPDPGIDGGFFSVDYRPDGDPAAGTATAQVTRIDVADLVLSPPITGRGALQFHEHVSYSAEENALMSGLGQVQVTGVALRDVQWLRSSEPPVQWTFPPTS